MDSLYDEINSLKEYKEKLESELKSAEEHFKYQSESYITTIKRLEA
jgi:phage-related minor tail protein